MNSTLPVTIRGTGVYAPPEILDNAFFSSYLDTSDTWIVERTGIRQRHRCGEGESTATLAAAAARRALQNAGLTVEDVDLVIVCTATPDVVIPSTSCMLQGELGIRNVPAFDVLAACSGFVYGLVVATSMLQTGAYRNVLMVGAETLTRFTDYQDRSTCILFGDAAAAVVLSPSDDPQRGILYWNLGADGCQAKQIWVPAGGSRLPASTTTVAERLHTMRMRGREVYKFAVVKMQDEIDNALQSCDMTADELKLIIPHQSNLRIIESARSRLGLPADKVAVNIDRYGNTSAASIGISFDEARRSGAIRPGDRILLVAFGAGLTWATALLQL
ncbi:MAG TPA: beta-ketoacyl-ACP synthase III [Phycisphaerae bacterium]|jgi:3-oxoacyl-[acyl-carrier-protein] synthase-3